MKSQKTLNFPILWNLTVIRYTYNVANLGLYNFKSTILFGTHQFVHTYLKQFCNLYELR